MTYRDRDLRAISVFCVTLGMLLILDWNIGLFLVGFGIAVHVLAWRGKL